MEVLLSSLVTPMGTGMRVHNNFFIHFSVIPHFAQNVERSVTTLAKDPHGDVDEAQFIDASKLVSKENQCYKGYVVTDWPGR